MTAVIAVAAAREKRKRHRWHGAPLRQHELQVRRQ